MTEDKAVDYAIRQKKKMVILSFVCDGCGDIGFRLFKSTRSKREYCQMKCQTIHRKVGPESHLWKGGRYVCKNGYAYINTRRSPLDTHKGQPHKDRMGEHRLVMERHLGRKLARFENVHHKNGVRDDNRIENLELWTKPQVPGQRVDDLVSWVADNYLNEIKAKILVRDAIAAILNRLQTEGVSANG